MALNIKNVEQLAVEIARLTRESRTDAIGQVLRVPDGQLGRAPTRAEREDRSVAGEAETRAARSDR